jgi:hypothetical protein
MENPEFSSVRESSWLHAGGGVCAEHARFLRMLGAAGLGKNGNTNRQAIIRALP